jgi:hypothetical protein
LELLEDEGLVPEDVEEGFVEEDLGAEDVLVLFVVEFDDATNERCKKIWDLWIIVCLRTRLAFALLQSLSGCLVRGGAVCNETRGHGGLEGCVGADTGDVGTKYSRTSQGSRYVEREEYAHVGTGIGRRRIRQAACDAAIGRLGRHTDCDHEESSENAQGVNNHRVLEKGDKRDSGVVPTCFQYLYVAPVARLTSSRVQDQIELAKINIESRCHPLW